MSDGYNGHPLMARCPDDNTIMFLNTKTMTHICSECKQTWKCKYHVEIRYQRIDYVKERQGYKETV